MTKRLLALDLDGTLLRDDGSIDARDCRAIAEFRRRGHVVVLATGRLPTGAVAIARQLGLDLPMICADGRILVHPTSGATLEVFDVPEPEDLTRRLRSHALDPFMLTALDIRCEPDGRCHLPYLATWSPRAIVLGEDEADWVPTLSVIGIGAQSSAARAHVELGSHVDRYEVHMFQLGDGPWAVRVQAGGHDKSTALARLAASLDVPREQVAAVGDWYNDIAMLRWAGRSFAMWGAPDPVAAAAGEVLDTPAGHGGGVAEALERWLGSLD